MRIFNPRAVGPSFDVCTIGNAIVDVVAEIDEAFLNMHKIPKGVMTLDTEEHIEYLYARVGSAIEVSGGSAANTAAGVAALGGTATYVGKVKDDQLGKIFRHDLRATGVHFATLPSTDGPATGRCLILVTPDAQRTMDTYIGACAELSEEDIDASLIRNTQIVFLEGYQFDRPPAQAAIRKAATIAHEADRQVAVSLSDPLCVERHREAFHDLVQQEADFLIANESELMALYETPSLESAMSVARKECPMVVVTRGPKGAVIAADEHTFVVAAERVDNVVDTTGAGDLFAAGFLYGVTHGRNLAESGRIGAIAASEVITHFGARPQRSLKELMAKKGLKT